MSSTEWAMAFDEVFGADGAPRAHAEALVAELERLGAENLVAARALRDRGGPAELSASVVMTRLDPATSARA